MQGAYGLPAVVMHPDNCPLKWLKGSAFFGKRLAMSDDHHDSDSLMDFSESDSGSGSGAEGASKRPV